MLYRFVFVVASSSAQTFHLLSLRSVYMNVAWIFGLENIWLMFLLISWHMLQAYKHRVRKKRRSRWYVEVMTGCLSTSQTASALLCGVGRIICRLFAFFCDARTSRVSWSLFASEQRRSSWHSISITEKGGKPSLLRSTPMLIKFDVAISSSNPRRMLKFSVDTDVGNFPSDSGSHHEWRC